MSSVVLLIFNVFAYAAFAVSVRHGLLSLLVTTDQTYLSLFITVLALGSGGYACLQASLKFIGQDVDNKHRNFIADCNQFAVLFGFLGTVIGIIIALHHIDPSKADTATGALDIIGGMIQGLYTTLYTTACGIVAYMWGYINYRLLGGDRE